MIQRVSLRDVAPALANDEHQLGFIVQFFGTGRADKRRTGGHDGVLAAHKQGRIIRDIVTAFLDVIRIVQAKANDRAGFRDRQGGVIDATSTRGASAIWPATDSISSGDVIRPIRS